MWIFFLQYKGAHVKPGFAEHFYSNPARYKGRDNMFVSQLFPSNLKVFTHHLNAAMIDLTCDVSSPVLRHH